ncbi:MAG TPA: aminoacetone oxidase family FAD-binding enzyme [Candidatus Faecousia intestinigallinarum]|nr:aminoacetone oxidase family FAD-binding enzyme [Candidatus Faecousia intestinigallinarum]
MTVGIIGAGASGMAAALAAAEQPGCRVVLLERQARVGRKLSATGNGRCNLTNLHAGALGYHGEQPEFAGPALEAFAPEETIRWFRGLGLFVTAEPSGRIYPFSDQANSVVDVLRFALEKQNICLKTGFLVEKVRKTSQGFLLEGNGEQIACDKLIVACGGLAGTSLGGSMSGYRLLTRLGHHTTRLRPALVQVKTDWPGVESLKGVRAECAAQVFHNDKLHLKSAGQIQFTQYGLSGPVIFEVSRDVCLGGGEWRCQLDLLPEVSAEELGEELRRRRERALPVEELLTGILHNRLGRVLTRFSGIRGKQSAAALSDGELETLCGVVKAFILPLTEPMGMDCAQVTAGGVRTEDFDPQTMESKLTPGLYACGEVLDIDGDCGGYNLQWAWSSGRMAGLHAGGAL